MRIILKSPKCNKYDSKFVDTNIFNCNVWTIKKRKNLITLFSTFVINDVIRNIYFVWRRLRCTRRQSADPPDVCLPQSDCAVSLPSAKPKIWSLADTAACKTPPPTGGPPGSGWLAGGTTFPLPPTIPPAQQQYTRFNHLMTGVNPAQYMAGYR